MRVMMLGSTTIPLNDLVKNVIDGELYQNAPWDCIGTLYVNGSAAGLTSQIYVGGTAVSNATTVNVQNRVPVVPDDMLLGGWVAFAGQPIKIEIVNTTGGNLTSYWRVELQSANLRRQ